MKSYFSATNICPNGFVGERLKIALSSTDYLYGKINVLSESKKEQVEYALNKALREVEDILKD